MAKLPATPKNIIISIEDVDEVQDVMRIYTEGMGYPIRISDFKRLVSDEVGKNIDFQHLVHNIAIYAALSGVDPTDLNAIKTIVEQTTFKV